MQIEVYTKTSKLEMLLIQEFVITRCRGNKLNL